MHPFDEYIRNLSRRHFLARGSHLLGGAALASLLPGSLAQAAVGTSAQSSNAAGRLGLSHFAPKAKRVIYLHMVGGPSQLDLFDHKPKMNEWYDKDLPESVRNGQRLTTMTSGQKRFPIAPSKYKFAQHGSSGMWFSELLPWKAKMADDLCFVRSMHTDAINHEPAITFMQTGNQVTGRPCLGSWVSYGLGSGNNDLPTFVVLVAKPSNTEQVQAISARLWSSGYLSGEHAGVSFRGSGDPILYINNPPGVPSQVRRQTLDGLRALNELNEQRLADPETRTRIQQYELAFRMQSSVPELTNVSGEGEATYKLYGEDAKKPGSFAQSVLLARRMVERGVRFIQVYSGGAHNDDNWDAHTDIVANHTKHAGNTDKPIAGLLEDLSRRGLLDETIVVWGGEFGRQPTAEYAKGTGRDHNAYGFTMWLAGGGIKGGVSVGETDELGGAAVSDRFHVKHLHATILQQMGLDPNKLAYFYNGLDQKLVGVEGAEPIRQIIA